MEESNKQPIRPPWFDHRLHIRRNLVRTFVHLFAWIGVAVLFYIGFSFFFDTPVEHRLKMSTHKLAQEYDALSARYDSVELVLDNVVSRDRNVFKTLFEAEPYNFGGDYESQRWLSYEKLLTKSNKELGEEFFAKSEKLEKNVTQLQKSYDRLGEKIAVAGENTNHIPAIQPVINPDLTLLTASFGLRIHPFYKSLTPHSGVDYTIPEDSRVFATADGRVKEALQRYGSTGMTVILDHGNGYETEYRHLDKINVRKGQDVRRGDIIALSGNTGLSLSPHLHYEIRHRGMRVDPIHYFFMELTPAQYQRMIRIAQSGMQSFD